ncbi:SixA phosphatase family protein [Rhodopseudomonas palustris]|uniref:Putative phosphohistidine phosphatase, SixA n=1 Tax=Rhodopseudomonas palustris (strain BisB18) TaxID=316056 RepID=Q218Z6_RHOPB
MRRLILLRHAKTESDAPSGKDHDRRLDDRGREDAAAIGGWLIGQQLRPELVLVSSAVRAQQTWAIVGDQIPADAPQPNVAHLAELYSATPATMLGILREVPGHPQLILLIGHNPGLHELALGLSCSKGGTEHKPLPGNMPTAAVAVIDFAIKHWGDASFGGGRLTQYMTPKLLKAPHGH